MRRERDVIPAGAVSVSSLEIPAKLVRCANAALATAAMLCTLTLLYAIYLRKAGILHYILPAIAGAALLASLKLRPDLKVGLALTVLATLLTLYSMELILWLPVDFSRRVNLRRAAAANGVEADLRSILEVVRDFRRGGVDAFPAPLSVWAPQSRIGAELRSAITIRGVETLPLGGVANKLTVLCNETGRYVTYESDEHGFNNPKGLWTLPRMQVAALGDSFVHGQCVPSDKNLIAQIRERYPATLNLGMAGTGPLLQLAVLREYLVDVKPEVVVWAFFEGNDLADLRFEKGSPLLVRYLNEDFRQGLPEKQSEIDRSLAVIVERAMARPQGKPRLQISEFATLQGLRWRVYDLLGVSPGGPQEDEYDLLRRILSKADRSVASWGGQLYFVYLPARGRYDYIPWLRVSDSYEEIRHRIIHIAQELKIPIVDIHQAFAAHGAPKAMFLYPSGHYSIDGYRVAAQTILDALHEPRKTLL